MRASPWAQLRLSATASIEALAAASVHVVESYARSRIELARAEFRQGRVNEGLNTLESLMRSLRSEFDTGEPNQGIDLVLAIAYSVLAQGVEQAGDNETARGYYRESASRFHQLDEDLLSPRDQSDYGMALAAADEEEAGYARLLGSRQTGGATPEASRRMATILLKGGDAGAAEELLRETLITVPTDPDALRMLGMIQAERGDAGARATLATAVYSLMSRQRYAEAIDVLDSLSSITPAAADLSGVRAESLRLAERPEEALESYAEALADHPDSPWLLAGSAATYLTLGRYEAAEEAVRHGLRSAPEDPDLALLAAEVALGNGHLDEAAEHARRAIGLSPGLVRAHEVLARALRDAGNTGEALGAIRVARQLAPADFDLLALHGDLEIEAGSLSTATEVFRQICADDSSLPAAHARLVSLLEAIGQPDSALAAGRAALERFGEDPQVLLALGRVAWNDDPAISLDYLRRAWELPQHDVEVSVTLAEVLQRTGDIDGALEIAAHAIDEAPESGAPYASRALALAAAERWEEAGVSAQKALERDPESVDAFWVLGCRDLSVGDLTGAEQWLREVLRLEPERVSARLYLARAVTESNPHEALTLLDGVIADGEHTVETFTARAQLYLDLDRPREAVADLRQAAELAPDDPTILTDLADGLRISGEDREALDVVDRALALEPELAYALAVRAAVYKSLGRISEAHSDLSHALVIKPDYSFAHILLAQVTSDPQEAQAHLDAARASSGSRDVEIEQAALFLQQEDYERAVMVYERLLADERGPELVAAHIDALRQAGRLDEAIRESDAALIEFGLHPLVRRSLALSLADAGRNHDALDILASLAESVGGADSWGDYGWALTANGQVDEALEAFSRSLRLAPNDVWTLNQTARLLSDIGEFAPAAELSELALQRDPDSTDAFARIGWAARYFDEPDFVRGLNACAGALARMEPGNEDPWVLSGRGDCRKALGDADAVQDFEKALGIARRDAAKGTWMLSTAGWCLFRLGDLRGAARMFLDAATSDAEQGSDAFDLALVTLCLGRGERAGRLYADALEAIRSRHPLVQRGLLKVARDDIVAARSDFPIEEHAATDRALQELGRALDLIPPPPPLAFEVPAAP